MNKFYHIEPIYQSYIWGGRKLIDYFELDPAPDNVGTVYHVIALPGHLDNRVRETGEPLSTFYKNHRALFGCRPEHLPVRMTTTCNEGRQSYQLHPTDDYAMARQGEPGKVSGSVTLECSDEARARLFGNTCDSLGQFKALVEARDWARLFQKITVKTGDFLHTPAGVIHGGEGDGKITCTFSTNGDITYRFYDFDRNDPGRPLDLQAVCDCVNIPEVPVGPLHVEPWRAGGILGYDYYAQPGEYVAKRFQVSGTGAYRYPGFLFLTCVGGAGAVSGTPICKGETLFILAGAGQLTFDGEMDLIAVSYLDKEA